MRPVQLFLALVLALAGGYNVIQGVAAQSGTMLGVGFLFIFLAGLLLGWKGGRE